MSRALTIIADDRLIQLESEAPESLPLALMPGTTIEHVTVNGQRTSVVRRTTDNLVFIPTPSVEIRISGYTSFYEYASECDAALDAVADLELYIDDLREGYCDNTSFDSWRQDRDVDWEDVAAHCSYDHLWRCTADGSQFDSYGDVESSCEGAWAFDWDTTTPNATLADILTALLDNGVRLSEELLEAIHDLFPTDPPINARTSTDVMINPSYNLIYQVVDGHVNESNETSFMVDNKRICATETTVIANRYIYTLSRLLAMQGEFPFDFTLGTHENLCFRVGDKVIWLNPDLSQATCITLSGQWSYRREATPLRRISSDTAAMIPAGSEITTPDMPGDSTTGIADLLFTIAGYDNLIGTVPDRAPEPDPPDDELPPYDFS
ncbi:MAG: hypothetical protein RQ731_08000 [Anaerosomatales bacterium]|nr:hypothetical protein [Anaerosomatales bacterium]